MTEINSLGYWKPPQDRYFKLNVDGALFFDLQEAGVGVILRDSKGDEIMAASLLENEVSNLESIESLATLRGLQPSMHLGISHLTFERDCQVEVNELLSFEESNSLLGNVFQDIKSLMTIFLECNIKCANRSCNGVSHNIARYSCNVNQ